MTDDLDPITVKTLYKRSGFITGAFLEPVAVTGVQHDANRLNVDAAELSRSEGDFNLEALEGGYHGQHQGDASHVPGVLRKVSNFVDHSPAAAAISERNDLHWLAATLTDAGYAGVELVHSILWCKPPGVGSPKPPHQDAAYLEDDPDRYVTFWIALDDCDSENGCLQVVPTSHRQDYPHVGAEPQIVPDVWESLSRMDVPLQPGWAIAFHPRLLHASSANTSDRSRRALMLRYHVRGDR